MLARRPCTRQQADIIAHHRRSPADSRPESPRCLTAVSPAASGPSDPLCLTCNLREGLGRGGLPDHYLRIDRAPFGEKRAGFQSKTVLNAVNERGRTMLPPEPLKDQILESERVRMFQLMLGAATSASGTYRTSVQFRTAHTSSSRLAWCAMTDRARFTGLILRIERGLLAQAQLRTLLAAADTTVAGHRQELRSLKARIARRSPGPGRSK
jgi:hypothetical protein